mmetsp:Transcript_29693/g.84980  ORF Transcript_29693/g.84980 Transcript_29693/m.84980 type:complete len:369 (+) Transcript_29693:337-1443(+)
MQSGLEAGGASGKSYAAEGYADIDAGWCKAGGNGFSDLQGGAGFETPGCSDPYACSVTPCINGKFTTPACYKWDSMESLAVKNVVLENIVSVNTNVGFFGAPLNEQLGVGIEGGFDLNRYRPSNIKISNFETTYSYADGINFHGSFDQVLVNRYVVREAEDDCIALWSYRAHMGAATIQNSAAVSCGYMGCYAVYGGSGPLEYTNNTCGAKGSANHHCLWLQDQFDGQFATDTPRVKGRNFDCNGWVCDGSARTKLCPEDSGAPWGDCGETNYYEAALCRIGNLPVPPPGYERHLVNCYANHGAYEIDTDATAPIHYSVDECALRCSDDSSCSCFTFAPENGKCWKRGGCESGSCVADYGTYVTFFKQ